MKNFDNAQTFANNYYPKEQIPKKLYELILFTYQSKSNRDINCILPFFYNITKDAYSEHNYIFNYNGEKYSFSAFSDYELQQSDKKILESIKRTKSNFFRPLKLAGSMDLINPRIAIGNSLLGTFDLLILFQNHGIDKVIDYNRNLIMNKDDYYKIFNFEELNIVNKIDLYTIYYIINELDDYKHIYEYLIFTKEIFSELSKKENFEFLSKKYDKNGFNYHNYLLFGTANNCLFFQEKDTNEKYRKLKRELDNFTKKTSTRTKHIRYDKKKEIYRLKERNFGYFTFDLLSDIVNDETIKEELLSDSRHHKCHKNAISVAHSLHEENKKSTYVVGGQIKINEIDYQYHSWVEIDKENVVIDFNYNIIMNRDKYYKLMEVKAISKTLISEIEEVIETIVQAKLNIHPFIINYLGKEFMHDLKKNEKIFRKI